MKRSVLVFLLATFAVFVVSGVSFAQEGLVELKYGAFNPRGNLDDDKWEQGTSLELSGTYKEDSMGIQGAIGWFDTDFSDSYNSILGRISEDDTITVIPVTLSLLGYFDNNPLHIYAGGGVGYYFAELEGDLNFKDAGFKFKDSDRDTVFGYHVMGGLHYDVTRNFLIGVEGKIIWTNEAKFELKDKGLKATYDTDLDGWIAAGKIGIKF